MQDARRHLVALTLLVVLPLSVTALTAVGLMRLDRILEKVAEEYGETRLLAPIERDLGAAVVALESNDPASRATAHRLLTSAEKSLVGYLATQYDDVSGEEHQAAESGHASSLLSQLQDVLRSEAGGAPSAEIAARVLDFRADLSALQEEADEGVMAAHHEAEVTRDSTLTTVFVASLASTLACIALLVYSMRSVNRRLRDLHRRLAAQSPGPRARTARDVGGVVTQIEELNTRMIQKIEESGRELLRRERLAGIGLLAADVAHEINNPMNAMLGLSELGLKSIERGPVDEPTRAELQESLAVVRREALRCKGIIERLMAMVRSDRTASWFDASRLVQETVQVARAARPDKASCFVATGAAVPIRVYGPADDVRQILLTLLINAADAVGPDGRIEADATQTEREVWFRVRDNGRGFSEAMRQSFFTPFRSYSDASPGSGPRLGLGLSIAQALAEGMGAALRPFSDGPGTGSLFVLAIRLPEETP
jgi:signal transduction histidine kinase